MDFFWKLILSGFFWRYIYENFVIFSDDFHKKEKRFYDEKIDFLRKGAGTWNLECDALEASSETPWKSLGWSQLIEAG